MDLSGPPLLAGSLGYLLGSVSFAHLLARLRGVDLRQVGSGNLGATNAARALGWKGGVVVYLLDAAKGALPAWAGLELAGLGGGVLGGAGAILGHVWPLWLRFRGGKGVATLTGVFLVLAPGPLLAAAGAMALAVLLTRRMSVGSLVLAAALPVAVRLLDPESTAARLPALLLALACLALACYTHRANIRRLLAGEEPPLGGGGERRKADG